MISKIISYLSLLTLFTTGALAQTGRIAHYSHGGSVVALAPTEEATDNFGVVRPVEWKNDSLVCVGNDIVEHRGLRREGESGHLAQEPWRRQVDKHWIYQPEDFRMLRVYYPSAILICPIDKRSSKKPAGRTQVLPKRSFQYSYWREVTSVITLGAVGWLLGKKRIA